MVSTLYSFLDLFWIPVALAIVWPRQRVVAVCFILLCALSLRLQIELMHSTGFDRGFTGWMATDLYTRGLIVYGVFTALYVWMLRRSRHSRWPILISASIVIFLAAFCVSLLVLAI